MNRRLAIPLAAVAVVTVAGGAAWALAGAGSASGTESTTAAHTTATVQRLDLVQHETVTGTLGYDDSEALYAQGSGTVTALRRPGAVVDRGEALYWVDAEPVTLLYGAVPMWRRLDASSADGADIRQLEQNLVALGYDPYANIEVDEDWDWATTAAVKRRQDDLGRTETGTVELGEIVFLPGPRRIGEQRTTVGAPLQPGGEVMNTSSTSHVVTVALDADKRSLVKKGDKVTVDLPDGSTVKGTIADVSKVAESEQDPQTGEQTGATIEVLVELARGSKTGDFDEAPVDVSLVKETAKDVLSVPVHALLALAEGGYAVEVVGANGVTRLVAVEPGMFADGLVEITGEGIAEGVKVVVPA